jgi:hypothetical protein
MPGQKRALHQDRAGNSAPREPRYFFVSAGFGWPVDEANRLASGRGLQSAGGKETRQKLGRGSANPAPTSGISLWPELTSTTMHSISSLVVRFFSFSSWPVIIGSRNTIAAPRALTMIVEVRSEKGAPPGCVPETRVPPACGCVPAWRGPLRREKSEKGGTRRKMRRASLRSSASRCVLLDPPQIASTCQGESLASV